jgi:hypothetical protein
MRTDRHRDLLRDIVARLSARGGRNLRTTIVKVIAPSGVQGNERADSVAKDATAPGVVTDYSQSLGKRPFDDMYWPQTYKYVNSETKAQADAGQVPHVDHLSPDDRQKWPGVRFELQNLGCFWASSLRLRDKWLRVDDQPFRAEVDEVEA